MVWYFLVKVLNGVDTFLLKWLFLDVILTVGVFRIKGVVWYFLFKVFKGVELLLLNWLFLDVIKR